MSGNNDTARSLLGRRDLLRGGAAAVAAFGISRMSGAEETAPRRRPNILLLHCHDLGAYLHCYGAATVQSPNLDAFAAQGVRFAHSYCTAPQCSPSRASLFTGRYPHNNGVMGLCHAEFAWDLHPGERHLAQILNEAGYATEAVGVIHETRSGAARCGYEKHTNKARVSEMATTVVERLADLARDRERPFFLCAGCIEPHRGRTQGQEDYMGFLSPEFGPDESLGVDVPGFLRDTPGTRAELAELQGAVRHVDTHMGRILAAVADLGLADNTLVVFTTDHGYAMPRAKCSLYDPGLAVSLILRLPNRQGWNGGGVRNEMISNIDCLPTLLELLDLPIPANVQGRSFAPLLDGRDYVPRNAIFGEISHHDYYDPRRCVRTETHKLILNFSSAPFYMDPSQSWRPRSDTVVPEDHAVAYHPCCELYDLRSDPWELNNLAEAPEQAETRAALLAQLRDHLAATKDPILDGAITPPQHRKSLGLLGLSGKPAKPE
jgi:arylsulfatase A-like enzyme